MSDAPGYFDRLLEFKLARNHRCHRGPTVFPVDAADLGCQLAVVEFDDQGLCFERGQLADVETALAALREAHPIVIAFAHGWKHNARSTDDNLVRIAALLTETRAWLRAHGSERPVLGVYVSWRGLSSDGNWLWMQSSFWGRQQAAHRVALGSARELFGILKTFRNGPPGPDGKPRATLIIVGHSFGGQIVFAAIAQSLIEAASSQDTVVPSYGDLVLLVNPAFSAVAYLPVHQIARARTFAEDQLPVFVSVTATNDRATGSAFRVGNFYREWSEDTRGPEQGSALTRTMGHLPWMQTHELTVTPPATAAAPASAGPGSPAQARTAMLSLATPGAAQTFEGVTVRRLPDRGSAPFWVASAPPEIINGHNDIFRPAFIGFVRALVAAHVGKPPQQAVRKAGLL